MALAAKDHLKEVVGLKNDVVHQVFICPECKAEVTISRWQVAGDLSIMCARCNARWQIRDGELLDMNEADKHFMGYNVFVKLTETQKNPPKPKPAAAPGAAPAAAAKPAAGAGPVAPVPAKPPEGPAQS